jgi:thiamine biosynthesis lipoprotein
MGTFRAMGTEVTVVAPALDLPGEASVTQEIATLFEAQERRFSRFREDSELSALNRATGPVHPSDELFDALVRASVYSSLTRGAFDCTLGAALVDAGYDRSFERGRLDRAARASAAPRPRGSLRLDPRRREVERTPATTLDLGGMIKGHTADLAATLLPPCAAVDAGGDAVLRGAGPDGEGWLVEVEDPFDAERTILTLRIRDAAVATSAANRRTWRVGDRAMHHLFDPRTGEPARSDLAQVTVVARTAELAEVLAKAVFILGAREGAGLLGRSAAAGAVLVTRDRSVIELGALEVVRD